MQVSRSLSKAPFVRYEKLRYSEDAHMRRRSLLSIDNRVAALSCRNPRYIRDT